MNGTLIGVPWGRLRAGVTVRHADGRLHRAAIVEHADDSVRVLFDDGHVERHGRGERAEVLTRAPQPADRPAGGAG
jgi:hypothetical protein